MKSIVELWGPFRKYIASLFSLPHFFPCCSLLLATTSYEKSSWIGMSTLLSSHIFWQKYHHLIRLFLMLFFPGTQTYTNQKTPIAVVVNASCSVALDTIFARQWIQKVSVIVYEYRCFSNFTLCSAWCSIQAKETQIVGHSWNTGKKRFKFICWTVVVFLM